MSSRVLVTGGAGFIGSHLVARLLEGGRDVRVLDNFSTGPRANLDAVAGQVEVVEGDLRSYERVHAAMRTADVVFHLGALPSVPRSVQDPLSTNAVNSEGTLNVLLAARDEGVRRVVFASSSSVYGNNGAPPRIESARPDPISPYAVSKLAGEGYCTSFCRVYAVETVALRYFNVFGPRQNASSDYAAAVPRFLDAVADDRPVTIHGDGRQIRDFTYVSDVVNATVLASDSEEANGQVFNVAAGRPVAVEELVDAVGNVLGRTPERRYVASRPGDVRNSWADVSAARGALGYEPRVALEEGLRLTASTLGSSPGAVRSAG